MLLIEPHGTEERCAEIVDRGRRVVEQFGGNWEGVESWGRRKLPFEINNVGEAWYYVLTFDAPAPVLHEATRVLAITDGVMRFMATNRIPGSSPAKPADRAETHAEEPETEPEQVEAGA